MPRFWMHGENVVCESGRKAPPTALWPAGTDGSETAPPKFSYCRGFEDRANQRSPAPDPLRMNSPAAIALREATFRLTLQGGTPTVSATSPGVQALLGYSEADFLSGRISLPALIHADDQDVADFLFSPARQGAVGD